MGSKLLEFKVGLLVIVVTALIGWMSFKVSEGPGLFGGGMVHTIEVENAGGLIERSAVKIAGIKVGLIEKIELIDGRARIKVRINDDVDLHEGTVAEIKADGILGDRHVQLIPGAATGALLTKPTSLGFKASSGSLATIADEVGKITDSLSEFAKNLNKATGVGDEETRIGRIISNLEVLTKDLTEISGTNKGKINKIVDNVNSLTERLDAFLADGDGEFSQAWSDMRDIIHRFDNTMKNFEEVSYKVNKGNGTLGQLINDDTTITGVNQTIEKVNEFIGNGIDLQTSIDYHSEFMTEDDRNKNYLSIRITPGLDRYYELGIVDDPSGVTRTTNTNTSGSTTSSIKEEKTFFDQVKFTALFAKNYHDFTIKGGIIESKGGVGVDYTLLNKKLRLSVEAFDFKDLYIRSFVRYNVFSGIYVTAGGDNLASGRGTDPSAFFGAGLFLTNDDLKVLASKISF